MAQPGTSSESGVEPAGRAICDLLGMLAYGELSVFDRLAEDARTAPTLDGRVALSKMAATEIGHFRLLEDHLQHELGISVEEAMRPFVGPLDAYHAHTAPRTWLESLVKVYIGDGLAADFYREVAGWLSGPTEDLVARVLADTGHAAFAEREVRAACEDRDVRDRLALWGRRLLGETVAQAQWVVAERAELAEFLVAGSGDRTGIAVLIKRVQLNHAKRMVSLGLRG